MNHGPSAASTLNDPPERSSDEISTEAEATNEPSSSGHITQTDSAAGKPWEERWTAKRKAALDGFFNTIDSLVYTQLMIIYYHDISTLFLVIRLASHLTPLPSTLSLLPERLRPPPSTSSLFPIIVVNLAAVIYHLFFELPQAGEATRFDLHGYLLIDFIGQRAPTGWTGRTRLVMLDCVILTLQTVACGVLVQGGKKALGATKAVSDDAGFSINGNADDTTVPHDGPFNTQGHESIDEEGGIELQPLMQGETRGRHTLEEGNSLHRRPSTEHSSEGRQNRGDALNEEVPPSEASAKRDLELLYSGQIVLVEICLWSLLRDQYYERRNRALAGRV